MPHLREVINSIQTTWTFERILRNPCFHTLINLGKPIGELYLNVFEEIINPLIWQIELRLVI